MAFKVGTTAEYDCDAGYRKKDPSDTFTMTWYKFVAHRQITITIIAAIVTIFLAKMTVLGTKVQKLTLKHASQ